MARKSQTATPMMRFNPEPIFELNATHFKVEDDSLFIVECSTEVGPFKLEAIQDQLNDLIKRINPKAKAVVFGPGLKIADICKVPKFIKIDFFRDAGPDRFEYIKVSDITSFSDNLDAGGKIVCSTKTSNGIVGLRTIWTEQTAEEIKALIDNA